MGLTYEEMMSQLHSNRSNVSKRVIGHKWNYSEPYKMICLACDIVDESKLDITFAFKVENEFVQKKIRYVTDGKGEFYWKQFCENAFPNVSGELTTEMILGRPFVAEIVKNEGFDNLTILSGYTGEFPDEVEGLSN